MKEYLDIYTDASWSHGSPIKKHLLGYCGVIFDDMSKEHILTGTITRKTVKDYFELSMNVKNISIHHGEIIAILKSLWQFRNSDKDIRIFSDSKVAMETLLKIRKNWKSGGYKNLVTFYERIKDKIESNGGSIDFFWVKGHSGCVGNNIADKNSKEVYAPKNEFKLKRKQKRKSNSFKCNKKKKAYITNLMYQKICSKFDPHSLWEKEVNQFKKFL